MTVAFGAQGTGGTGGAGGTLTVAVPTMPAHAVGDLILYMIGYRPGTVTVPAAPSGWTLLDPDVSGGQGAEGIDAGTTTAWCYYKVATSTSETVPAFTVTGSPSTGTGVIHVYTNATGAWEVAASAGADNTAGTSWSATSTTDAGFTAGDWVVTFSAHNSDGAGAISARATTITGCTMGAQNGRTSTTTNQGNDSRSETGDRSIASGTSSGNATYTCTTASSGTNFPAGVTLFVRIREASAAIEAAATLDGTGTLTAGAEVERFAAATLDGTGTLTATADVTPGGPILAAAVLDGTGTITATATVERFAAVTLAGTGTITAAATVGQPWGPPANLTATPISQSQIDLSWDAMAGASGYDIERDLVVIATDVVATSYNDTGLTGNTEYDYRVRSVRA